jgi:flagellar biosynthetic protein FliO
MLNLKDLMRGGESRKVLLFLAAVVVLGTVALSFSRSATSAPATQQAPSAAAAATPAPTGLPHTLTPDSPVPVYGDTSAAVTAEPSASWTDIVGLCIKLALVIGLLVVALRALKRFTGGGRRMLGGGDRAIQVLESAPLAQGSNVYLVSVGDRVLLLGGTGQQVSLLTEVEDPALLDRFRPDPEAARTQPGLPDFGALLGQFQSAGRPRRPE